MLRRTHIVAIQYTVIRKSKHKFASYRFSIISFRKTIDIHIDIAKFKIAITIIKYLTMAIGIKNIMKKNAMKQKIIEYKRSIKANVSL
jgi:galactitol-specific phosphotransferase system IIB component